MSISSAAAEAFSVLGGEAVIKRCSDCRGSLKGSVQQPLPLAFLPQDELPNGWTWGSVSQICERVSVGHVGPTSKHFSDEEGSVLLIRSQNVRPGLVDLRDCVKITRDFHEKLKKSQLKNGDVLIVRVGANRSDTASLKGQAGPINCANIVFARPFFPNGFLSYYLQSPIGRDTLLSLSTGAAQGVINTTAVASMPVPVPPLATQERIASILSAYDDLIENNTRRIAILEEMAQRLYEEWFVHFRFPGHEEAEFEGDLPSGWLEVLLGELVEEKRDAINPETIDPETPYVGLEHIPRRSVTMREWSTVSSVQSTKLSFNEDDILFGKIRPYFHKVALAPIEGVASSDTIILRAFAPEHLPLALCCASSDAFVDHATQTSNGTKMPRANWKVLSQYPVALPDQDLLQRFNAFLLPLLKQLKAMNRQNANLRAQRDLLLPKLVSCVIDVSEAEKSMEAAE